MEKLSAPMVDALRTLARGEQPPAGPTRAALLRRGYAKWLTDEWTRNRSVEITQEGRDALDGIERGERAAALDERLSRAANATGAPAVEAKPIKRATFRPADEITVTTGDSGPSVRLTPAPADTKREATDAEVLQLCAMLDAGAKVARRLYQVFAMSGLDAITTDLDAVNRAARDAVRFGLARQVFVNREYVLTAEPIHLDAGTMYTACGIWLVGLTIRHRVTTDPGKVTHERCLTT